MKGKIFAALAAALPLAAYAHFGVAIPGSPILAGKAGSDITLRVAFCHPMERGGMTMEKPESVAVVVGGEKKDITGTASPDTLFGKQSWKFSHKAARPGVYQFLVTPSPYWEPAEDKFIVHYTKVVVPAYGDEDGWDEPTGAPTEIIPLTRPFGNYAGNVFQGRVTVGGKAAPGAEVEVEYFNEPGDHSAPSDYHVTQVVKADRDGVFTFAVPWDGWWGFAALTDADYRMKQDGADKDVELGAVLWTRFEKPRK